MPRIPEEARSRLLAGARLRMRSFPRVPQGMLPLTQSQWERLVEDARVPGWSLEDEVRLLLEAAENGDAPVLRIRAEALVGAALDMAERLACVGMFRPAGQDAYRLADAIRAATLAALDLVQRDDSRDAPTTEGLLRTVQKAADALRASREDVVDSPLGSAFGLADEEMCDERGVWSAERVVAAYYGRWGELSQLVERLLKDVLAVPVEDPTEAVRLVAMLIGVERAFIAARTFRSAKGIITQAVAEDLERAATFISDFVLGVDRSRANSREIVRTRQALRSATAPDEVAFRSLDLYRRMMEGQFRPPATLLLCLRRGVKANPLLATLRDMLAAEPDPCLREASTAVLSAARNAAAHEEYYWDFERELLVAGDKEVSVEALADATAYAYAFMAGVEIALRASRTEDARLGDAIDVRTREVDRPRALRERDALLHFSTNGLHVISYQGGPETFRVVVQALPRNRVQPMFQALVWASRLLLSPTTFVVAEAGAPEGTSVAVTRRALDAASATWAMARRLFVEMPTSTFLAANFDSRRRVEPLDVAGAAVAWMALDDARRAYDEFHATPVFTSAIVSVLAARLSVAAAGVEAAVHLVEEECRPLRDTHELLAAAARWTGAVSRGLVLETPARSFEDRIHASWSRLVVPSVLPPVDTVPIDEWATDSAR